MATPTMTTKPRATAPAARMDPHTARRGMFVLEDGRNVVFTFFLLVFLFALWGFCNGMIDVMDKHFQEELHLNLAQSAWVQFAHYLGYFLMAIPAGWLAIKLGYKGGIIAGLLMVAAGGFWFIPASHIAQFWAFLLGVCIIAAGLTFLETIANPYTTVLGPPHTPRRGSILRNRSTVSACSSVRLQAARSSIRKMRPASVPAVNGSGFRTPSSR